MNTCWGQHCTHQCIACWKTLVEEEDLEIDFLWYLMLENVSPTLVLRYPLDRLMEHYGYCSPGPRTVIQLFVNGLNNIQFFWLLFRLMWHKVRKICYFLKLSVFLQPEAQWKKNKQKQKVAANFVSFVKSEWIDGADLILSYYCTFFHVVLKCFGNVFLFFFFVAKI